MVHSCCVYGCKERFVKGSGISFHCFPSDEKLKQKWVSALKRETFVPTVYSKICSKHFTPECFVAERFGSRWLKPDAVPSIIELPQQKKKSTPLGDPPKKTSEISEVSEPETPATDLQACSGERKLPLWCIGDFSEVEMSSSVNAKKLLAIAMEQIEIQRRKINDLQTKEARLEKRVKYLESILSRVKEKSSTCPGASSTLKFLLDEAPVDAEVELESLPSEKETRQEIGKWNGECAVKGFKRQKLASEGNHQSQIVLCKHDHQPLNLTVQKPQNSSSQ